MNFRVFFIKIIFILSPTLFALNTPYDSLSSSYDPLNAYRFNRDNYIKQNGKIDKSPWFEWWYYKVVLPEKNKSFFFVYGVVNPWDVTEKNSATRSYVTMGAFASNIILEKRFPLNQFSASYTSTQVNVGNQNEGTESSFRGDITSPSGDKSVWDISIDKKWTFNAASWATGKNITNIEWYPAQTDARCSGKVIVNDEIETFENAPCYQDRNWGTLFPEWWAWIVSNHFEESPNTTLAIGGGKPTIFDHFNRFESVAIGLHHKGKEYKWRPHEGDFIKFEINFGIWNIEASNKKYRIKISASAPREKFMDLQFITPQGRTYHDYEALQGDLQLQLFERSPNGMTWVLKERLSSHQAGIEYGSYQNFDNNSFEALNLCLVGCSN